MAVFFKEAVFWQCLKVKLAAYNSRMVYSFVCLDHSKIDLKCSLTDQSCVDWDIKLYFRRSSN